MRTTGLKGEGGQTLTYNRALTNEFQKISGNRSVQVGWNGVYNMWNLLMNGRYIMSMKAVNSQEKNRVYTHFRKLRSNGYDNVKQDMRDQIAQEEKETRYAEQQVYDESVEIGTDMLVKQKESVNIQRKS